MTTTSFILFPSKDSGILAATRTYADDTCHFHESRSLIAEKSPINEQGASSTTKTTTMSGTVAAATPTASTQVRQVYRELFRLIRQLDAVDTSHGYHELRTKFREPLVKLESPNSQSVTSSPAAASTVPELEKLLQQRLKEAESRLSFLRMTCSNPRGARNQARGLHQLPPGSRQKFVYRNGERFEVDRDDKLALRDGSSRVVSSYDGKNLDPSAVSRHKKQLRRAGFVNNTHAKGIF
jgi:hypothetical protein